MKTIDVKARLSQAESLKCHPSVMRIVANRAKMTDKKREEKVNLTFPILSELVSSSRFVLAPANCDEFGFKATNQEVLDSSTTRGTKWYGEAMRLNTQYTSQDCRTIENKAL